MSINQTFLALDVGEKRIGVARGDSGVRLASVVATIDVDGSEIEQIERLYRAERANLLVVGYPRNQSGEATQQTAYVESFVRPLQDKDIPVYFQDESLTSVLAEERLKRTKKPYRKGDIDALAAALILQDYLERL